MDRRIVVAFRMPPGALSGGPEGAYLARARRLCARGEALGAELIAWSAASLALACEDDTLEEAIVLAAGTREEALEPARAWACGISEGALESFDGPRSNLAWGEALVSATSLAKVAHPGEVLVDGDMRAVRAGLLALLGPRAATDAGRRVRGWKLDVDHPWRRPLDGPIGEATDRVVLRPAQAADAAATQEMPALEFTSDELSTSEVLQIVEASASADAALAPSARGSPLAERMRRLTAVHDPTDAAQVLAELRRARAAADQGSARARCQAALALAMTLSLAGRAEEALLEALDALARAREGSDARAVGACLALLAKLYAGTGRAGEAAALRETAGV